MGNQAGVLSGSGAHPLVIGLIGTFATQRGSHIRLRGYNGNVNSAYEKRAAIICMEVKLDDLTDVAVLDLLGNPVLFVGRDGTILRANPAACSSLRLKETHIGQRVGDLFGLSVDDMLMRAWERHGPISAVTTIRRVDPESPTVFNVSVWPKR